MLTLCFHQRPKAFRVFKSSLDRSVPRKPDPTHPQPLVMATLSPIQTALNWRADSNLRQPLQPEWQDCDELQEEHGP